MDNEVIKRGRKPNEILNNEDLEKQQKRHQYYLNFKKNTGPCIIKKLIILFLGDQRKKPHQFQKIKTTL